ncbi:hypothetical protein ID866_8081 [Astraeus odoratus]|nr:hypothetical protein ID866_8081 [Astraeus odoratus]
MTCRRADPPFLASSPRIPSPVRPPVQQRHCASSRREVRGVLRRGNGRGLRCRRVGQDAC